MATTRGRRAPALVLAVILGACGGAPPPQAPPPVPIFSAQSGFARVSSEYLEAYHAAYPVRATQAGIRVHDARMPSLFPGDLERRTSDVRAFLTRLDAASPRTLQGDDRADHRVLDYAMRAELLDLEEIGGWRRDPSRYVHLIAAGTEGLLRASFGSPDERARALAGRWRAVPLLLRAARQNLDPARVPRLFVEAAVADARATRSWLHTEMPSALDAHGIARAGGSERADLEAARGTAVASLDSFTVWLERELGPAAAGDFRLGATRLESLLRYEHHVGIPLADLYALNRQAIDEYREWMTRVAMSVDPMRRPEAIIESMTRMPGATELIPPDLVRDASVPGPGDAPTRVRSTLAPPALVDSWLHFRDLATLEDPALDDAARLAGIRRALHGHALVHVMLTLHSGNASLEEAAQDFASIALVGRAQAMREARRIAHHPGGGVVAIGRLQSFALRDRLRAERPGSFDARVFERDLIRLALPVPLAAEMLLGREPGPLLVAGARTPGLPPLPGPLGR